jgi:hypothetical protein
MSGENNSVIDRIEMGGALLNMTNFATSFDSNENHWIICQ